MWKKIKHFGGKYWPTARLVFAGVSLVVLPLVTIILSEMVGRAGSRAALQWLVTAWPFVLTAAWLLFLVGLFVYALTGSLGIVALGTGGWIFLACVNHWKAIYRGEPMLFADLYTWREGLTISGNYDLSLPITAIKAFIAWGVLTLAIFIIAPHWRRCRSRLIALVASILLLLSSYFLIYRDVPGFFEKINVFYFTEHDPRIKVELYGFVPVFIIEAFTDRIQIPGDYDAAFFDPWRLAADQATGSGDLRPDVIVILSESFADVATYPGVTMHRTVTPTFDALTAQADHGKLLVNARRGGGTAQTEFEVLTGLSSGLNPSNLVAYNHFLTRDFPALPRYFEDNGYQTVAIHPSYPWFYRRNKVYPWLGIARFDDYETFTPRHYGVPQDMLGGSISFIVDEATGERIIEVTEENTDTPKFIMVVTIENHGAYSGKAYPDEEYASLDYALEASVSADQKRDWENFLIGVRQGDKMLAQLVSHFAQSERPTMIVFFGDHFPGIIDETANTIIADNKLTEMTTPFLIWNNWTDYDAHPGRDYGTIGSFYLPVLTLESINWPLPAYYRFLSANLASVPGFNHNYCLSPSGQLQLWSQASPQAKKFRHDFWLWQYDLLFGRQYTWSEAFGWPKRRQAE